MGVQHLLDMQNYAEIQLKNWLASCHLLYTLTCIFVVLLLFSAACSLYLFLHTLHRSTVDLLQLLIYMMHLCARCIDL
jgi:hypothetical protein